MEVMTEISMLTVILRCYGGAVTEMTYPSTADLERKLAVKNAH